MALKNNRLAQFVVAVAAGAAVAVSGCARAIPNDPNPDPAGTGVMGETYTWNEELETLPNGATRTVLVPVVTYNGASQVARIHQNNGHHGNLWSMTNQVDGDALASDRNLELAPATVFWLPDGRTQCVSHGNLSEFHQTEMDSAPIKKPSPDPIEDCDPIPSCSSIPGISALRGSLTMESPRLGLR